VPAQGGADDLSRFLIRSPAQIGQILRAIADHGELVTAYFNRGREFLLTAIVDVDIPGKTVLIDRATEPALNEKLLASDRIVLVSAHEKVKVQFSARQVREAQSGGRPAFAFALPVDLLKLQRREFFRVRAAAGEPVRCRLPLTDRDLLDLPVLDISIGGIAAHAPLPAALAQVGRLFPRASLQIGDGGAFIVDLELRNVNAVRLPNGIDALRCGFRFVGLPEVAQQQIQRYILRVERDRKSREAELRA
jgi:c-di-GMP-binding flagellar brake protein YcgR